MDIMSTCTELVSPKLKPSQLSFASRLSNNNLAKNYLVANRSSSQQPCFPIHVQTSTPVLQTSCAPSSSTLQHQQKSAKQERSVVGKQSDIGSGRRLPIDQSGVPHRQYVDKASSEENSMGLSSPEQIKRGIPVVAELRTNVVVSSCRREMS
jgi:hypothetical protein